jgi:hypothetical protein
MKSNASKLTQLLSPSATDEECLQKAVEFSMFYLQNPEFFKAAKLLKEIEERNRATCI